MIQTNMIRRRLKPLPFFYQRTILLTTYKKRLEKDLRGWALILRQQRFSDPCLCTKAVTATFLPFQKLNKEWGMPAHTNCGFPSPHGNRGVKILRIFRIQQLSESPFTHALTHACFKPKSCCWKIDYNLHCHLEVIFRQIFKSSTSLPTNTIHK